MRDDSQETQPLDLLTPATWQQRNDAASTIRAAEIIRACGIEAGQDFFTLSGSQVTALLAFADAERYRKPRAANGSRGRYYYARLQRLARRMPLDLAQRLAGVSPIA